MPLHETYSSIYIQCDHGPLKYDHGPLNYLGQYKQHRFSLLKGIVYTLNKFITYTLVQGRIFELLCES
jgi:hypothetical protein